MIKWQTRFACCILCELSLLLHDSVIYTVIPYWLKVNEKVNHGHFNIQCIVFCLWEIAYAYGKLCCKLTQIFNSGQHKTRPTSKMTRYGAQLIFLVNVGYITIARKIFRVSFWIAPNSSANGITCCLTQKSTASQWIAPRLTKKWTSFGFFNFCMRKEKSIMCILLYTAHFCNN